MEKKKYENVLDKLTEELKEEIIKGGYKRILIGHPYVDSLIKYGICKGLEYAKEIFKINSKDDLTYSKDNRGYYE